MKMMKWAKKKLSILHCFVCGSVIPLTSIMCQRKYLRSNSSRSVGCRLDVLGRQTGVDRGKRLDPIGWHAAHKTLPIGTLIRVSNPKNGRSTERDDQRPWVPFPWPDRQEPGSKSLGAGALLGFKGLGTVYMEVLSIPPVKTNQRPIVESLFAVNDANANCVGRAPVSLALRNGSGTTPPPPSSGSSGSGTGCLALGRKVERLGQHQAVVRLGRGGGWVGRPQRDAVEPRHGLLRHRAAQFAERHVARRVAAHEIDQPALVRRVAFGLRLRHREHDVAMGVVDGEHAGGADDADLEAVDRAPAR